MEEIDAITAKYDEDYIRRELASASDVTRFALTFYKDVGEVFDHLTRVRNVERNRTGFSLNDAPILGLLVRMWKLFKEIVRYYEGNNGEIASVLDRPLLEASVTAAYLMQSGQEVLEDYRKCSYKHRLRMLREHKAGSAFYDTKAGKRLLSSIREKMAFEGLSESDFTVQQKNGWRLQGKNFYDIFTQVHSEDFYATTFGIMSESIHASWNDSLDFCLRQNDDGTFAPFPFYQPADIRFVSPLILLSLPTYSTLVTAY